MVIAIINQKGGTGKTTTTVNLGAALHKRGKDVMLVDLDPQGNMGYSFGIQSGEVEKKGMTEVMLEGMSIDEVVIEKEGLSIAPSDITLSDAELSLASEENREHVLKEAFEKTGDHDYVLLDCPPSLSLLTINALKVADKVVIPMQMEVLALKGLELIVSTLSQIKKGVNKRIDILGILPVMIDKRRKLSAEVLEHIKENYAVPVFESQIRNNVKATEAPSFGQSVISYAPNSNSAIDYLSFADEVIKLTSN